eukprot:3011584-Prorocentrum_lima.AAC.1
MEELRMLEADEKAAAYAKSSWKSEEAVLGNVAAVELKTRKVMRRERTIQIAIPHTLLASLQYASST